MESLEQGYADSRFTTAVDEDLHCPICLNVLKDPLQCQMNEHYFCTPCITRHLGNFQTCPSCMEELSVKTLRKPARYLTKHLSKLDIRCENENRGCPEFVKLEDLNNHLTICGFAPVTSSNNGCSQVINKQDMIRHETEICELRKTKCHECAEMRIEMGQMREDMGQMREEMGQMREEKGQMREDMGQMRGDMGQMREEIVGQLKMSFAELKDQMSKIINVVEMKGVLNPSPSLHVPCPVEDKEDIIVVGGYNGVDRLVSSEMFVWSKNKWLPLNDVNEPRSVSSSTLYKNQLLVVGGRTDQHNLIDSIEALCIDKQPAQWSYYPAKLPYPCSGHSCIVYQDRLIVIGGLKASNNKGSNSIHEVHLTPPYTSKLLSCMPQPRNHHGTVCFGDEIVIIGGLAGYSCNHMKSVLLFNIKTNMCKAITPLPYPISCMATVKWGDNVILLGGQNYHGETLNTVMMYNIQTGETHMLPAMIHERASVVTGNMIVVIGGHNKEQRKILNTVEYFSFASLSWTELPSMIERRSCATAVVKPVNFA